MEYARRLAKHIQVDIFGTCGKRGLNKMEAHRMIRENCKFYLAFENSNCRQYITEKFWINALGNDAIPIVMGAPKDDYVKAAPPYSFIHVDDYTPEQLSRYLHHLDSNQTAYNEYFAWKKYGRVVGSNFFCRLCSFVQSPPRKTYSSVEEWWKDSEDCEKYAN
ncbi:Fucosyl transferase [Trichostrongylus colubriformis]|uniref:Fucosyltransferase n=1 Tax=Trichostrongylus colubriformis TaxID=6319 RepID=A0AAN8F148_TRICO